MWVRIYFNLRLCHTYTAKYGTSKQENLPFIICGINLILYVIKPQLWNIRKNERGRWTKWKPHKDAACSFHTKEQNVYCTGGKLSVVKQVVVAENSIIGGHTDCIGISVHSRWIRYTPTLDYPKVWLKMSPTWTSLAISLVRVLKMSFIHWVYSLLISVRVKRSLREIRLKFNSDIVSE